MTIDAQNRAQDSTTPEMVRRRRAASRRLPPTPRGWRDPLDGLARGQTRAPRARRQLPPFLYVDRDGNVRDQSGAMLRSRLDVVLDAHPNRPPPPGAALPYAVPAPRRATDDETGPQRPTQGRGRGCAA